MKSNDEYKYEKYKKKYVNLKNKQKTEQNISEEYLIYNEHAQKYLNSEHPYIFADPYIFTLKKKQPTDFYYIRSSNNKYLTLEDDGSISFTAHTTNPNKLWSIVKVSKNAFNISNNGRYLDLWSYDGPVQTWKKTDSANQNWEFIKIDTKEIQPKYSHKHPQEQIQYYPQEPIVAINDLYSLLNFLPKDGQIQHSGNYWYIKLNAKWDEYRNEILLAVRNEGWFKSGESNKQKVFTTTSNIGFHVSIDPAQNKLGMPVKFDFDTPPYIYTFNDYRDWSGNPNQTLESGYNKVLSFLFVNIHIIKPKGIRCPDGCHITLAQLMRK